jgi:ribonuclease Z
VLSGDTRKSTSLVRHAKGADLLIHEVLDPAMTGRAIAVAQGLGMQRLAKLAGDIPDYHATPRDVGLVAKEAGVAHVVLTHLVPPPRNALLRRSFERGVAESFEGRITVGEDGMRFALAPAAGKRGQTPNPPAVEGEK